MKPSKGTTLKVKQFDPDLWLRDQKSAYQNAKVDKLKSGSVEHLQMADRQGCLFHGTPSRASFKVLNPRTSRLHDSEVIFAGFPWVAICFIARWTDRSVSMGTVDGKPYFHIHSHRVYEDFIKGGFVCQISPETFFRTERLTSFEFISTQKVPVISSVFVPDPLESLRQLGVDLLLPDDF